MKILLPLMGYRATRLPIVSHCVENATYGLPIVGSPLELNDNSCFKNNLKGRSQFESIQF